jgi:CsoR family transcriptional regulator, copper-sensing transcriptional repressor
MDIPDRIVDDLRQRLRRVEGQVRGIQRMLDEHAEPRDVAVQVSAARNALEQVGFRLLAASVTYCVQHPDEAADSGYHIDELERLFMKLS